MKKRANVVIFMCLAFVAIYIGIRRYYIGPFFDAEISILILGILLGMNMLFYIFITRPGKEQWIVYATGPFIVAYLFISKTKNVTLPLVMALCVLVAINVIKNFSRISENRTPSDPL
ncbi:MAG TPA: hypothetical protein VGB07_24845 [Blastocatellia bacterium]|jgi:hypothetical protein